MEERLQEMFKLSLSHFEQLTGFINLVSSNVLGIVNEESNLARLLKEIINTANTTLLFTKLKDDKFEPELVIESMQGIRNIEEGLINGFETAKKIAGVEEINSLFDKAISKSKEIIYITNDYVRTYSVNIEEEKILSYLQETDEENVEYVRKVLEEMIILKGTDEYGQEMLKKVELVLMNKKTKTDVPSENKNGQK